MDIEFHYYVTYLAATRAGFEVDDACILAYSSQYVDNNDILFEINKDSEVLYYKNYISQTLNILKPLKELLRIYPFFHFIPGDNGTYLEKLRENVCPVLNTIPDNINANQMIDEALVSNDLYKIGIACHAYLDTWSHQNFVGMQNEYNGLFHIAPNIGHADVGHKPDIPTKVWEDPRLQDETINNKERFLEAISRLFEKLYKYNDESEKLEKEKNQFIEDLDQIITESESKTERIKLYKQLALEEKYGGKEIEDYDEFFWFNEAIKEDYPEKYDIDLGGVNINLEDMLFRDYTWQDPDNYSNTHWYKFQEAVKAHQDKMAQILNPYLEDISDKRW